MFDFLYCSLRLPADILDIMWILCVCVCYFVMNNHHLTVGCKWEARWRSTHTVFWTLMQCKWKRGYTVYELWFDMVGCCERPDMPFLCCLLQFLSGRGKSTPCSGQDVCSEIVVHLQLCLLEQETSLNSITVYPVH